MSSDETDRTDALLWGANQQDPARRRRAVRYTIRHAIDATDARRLLDMLGLLPDAHAMREGR